MLSTTATTSPRGDLVARRDRDRRPRPPGAGCARCRPRRARPGAARRRPRPAGRAPCAEIDRAVTCGRRSASRRSCALEALDLDARSSTPSTLDPVAAAGRPGGRGSGSPGRGGAARSCGRPRRRPAGARGARRRRSARARAAVSVVAELDRRLRAARRRRAAAARSRRASCSRSSQAVSTSPARTSGRSSSSSRKPWLVVPPSTHDHRLARAPGAAARSPRRGRAPRRSPWRSSSRTRAGSRRPRRRRCRRACPGRVGSAQQLDRARARARSRAPGSSAFRAAPRSRGRSRGGRLALEPPARGDVELQLDQVEPGDSLGHRVLDLEPGVDLHERERAARSGS